MGISQYLQRSEGRIAYEVVGESSGPLVICAPGMGELRQSYRHLAPALVEQGYRVAMMDLRGHGESDVGFESYDDLALAGDLLALIEQLGQPAIVVGNSMAAGASVIAAAESPSQVLGLALLGPFVRNGQSGAFGRLLMRLLLTKPWGPTAFMFYYARLLPGSEPADQAEHTKRVRDNLSRPGHWKAFVRTSRTSHAAAEKRLHEVRSPAVVVMGGADIDWKFPPREARWIGTRLNAEVRVIPGVGHYPQVQAPETTASAITALIESVKHG